METLFGEALVRRVCGESTFWGNVVGIVLCWGYELANRPQVEDQNKSVKNKLLGNEMNTGATTLLSVGYATTPLLLGIQGATLLGDMPC